MRCQYCGKRLPLFRKLKDGEFCSADHRQQFLAQSNELAVAALQQQRERTRRAQGGTAVAVAEPSTDASFCDRYLSTKVAALPLRQLALMTLEPMRSPSRPFMPERDLMATLVPAGRRLGEWLPALPADQTLRALNDYGAAHAEIRSSLKPSVPVARLEAPGEPSFRLPGPITVERPLLKPGELSLLRPAAWIPGYTPLARLSPPLSTDCGHFRAPVATSMAGPVTFGWPELRQSGSAWREIAVHELTGPRFIWCKRHPWALGASLTPRRALAPLVANPIAPGAVMPIAAAVARSAVPDVLYPEMPSRPAAVLRSSLALCVRQEVFEAQAPGVPIAPVAGPFAAVRRFPLVSGGSGLQIEGQLSDLLEPAYVAPAVRLQWALGTLNPQFVRSVPAQPLARSPQRPLHTRATAAGVPFSLGQRNDRQLPLNLLVKVARWETQAPSDSVTFHLEPPMMQPRLRAQPDPARQGRGQSFGRNHVDEAMSSIRIPLLRRFWAHAPADIRWVALVVPLVFFLVWYSWTPGGQALNKQGERADLAVDTSGMQTVLASFKSRISSRAAVELGEDFRAGLGEWQGARENWAENWSYDQAGFVRPGNLAIFTPTLALADYSFEFMGQIENRAMNWVYRAKDPRNYYAGKLLINRAGPMPEVALLRSVVKDGREVSRKLIVLTMNLRSDTLYRIRVDVNGSNFTTSVLGQVVDTFTDELHSQGGIGFYGGHGETGRIRWVEVSHQYDTIGRLCAMFVPYGFSTAPVKTVVQ